MLQLLLDAIQLRLVLPASAAPQEPCERGERGEREVSGSDKGARRPLPYLASRRLHLSLRSSSSCNASRFSNRSSSNSSFKSRIYRCTDRGRSNEAERGTNTDRQTDRQADAHGSSCELPNSIMGSTKRGTHTERERETHTDTDAHRHRCTQTQMHTDADAHRQRCTQTDTPLRPALQLSSRA